MVPAGLINRVYDSAANIDFGRKGFAIRGKAYKVCQEPVGIEKTEK